MLGGIQNPVPINFLFSRQNLPIAFPTDQSHNYFRLISLITTPVCAVEAGLSMWIDLYLPGFRDIGRFLGANPGTMQTALAVVVGGAAIGQLLKRTEI
jgi:hypothetical protein